MMPKHRHRGVMMEGLIMPTKIRKRGCSSSSSSSSIIHHYRVNKRAILVGKRRVGSGVGLGESRASTPVPTWRTTPLRSLIDSPKYSGKSTQAVSARRLAASLWEMNEIPSPKISESNLELMKLQQKNKGSKMVFKRDKIKSGWGLHTSSGSLPPHLSDPSHSPTVSEKTERTGVGSRQTRRSVSQRLRSAEQNAAVFDSISKASFMEIETRSRPLTSSGSISGGWNRLKDVSNALTTSKELLKIINRIWAQADQPSSSMSLISALHAELERARLQVNQFIQEQRMDKNEINHLMTCFAEEKISWEKKEHQAIEAAIASIASELEVEQKLRRQLESLNKKLGRELAEMKSSFLNAVKELESEKRTREITEQVCDELAKNIDEGRAEVEKLTSESVEVHEEEAEKERAMIELADKLHEGRVQMKLSEAKHQFEEKNSAIGKLKKQLEVFLGTKRGKEGDRATCMSKSNISSLLNEQRENGEVDVIGSKRDSAENDHHLIELNKTNKSYKLACSSAVGHDPKKLPADEIKARNSIYDQVSRRCTSLQSAVSDGVERGIHGTSHYNSGDGLNRQRFQEYEKEAHRRSYFEERERHKNVNSLRDNLLSCPRLSSTRDCYSPSPQRERPCLPDILAGTIQERHIVTQSKSRMADVRGEGQTVRRSKW